MTEDCIFCRIVAGQAEASVAYEDDATMAFMDLGPFADGHALVVPKEHVRDIFALDEGTAGPLLLAVSRVAQGVRDAFEPHGITIWQSNGAPWQDVFHLHFHILPRWRHDGLLRFTPPERGRPSRAVLDDHAAKIRSALEA
ncbi:MAG: HIT family protein [Dehalococcoidia bacterium]